MSRSSTYLSGLPVQSDHRKWWQTTAPKQELHQLRDQLPLFAPPRKFTPRAASTNCPSFRVSPSSSTSSCVHPSDFPSSLPILPPQHVTFSGTRAQPSNRQPGPQRPCTLLRSGHWSKTPTARRPWDIVPFFFGLAPHLFGRLTRVTHFPSFKRDNPHHLSPYPHSATRTSIQTYCWFIPHSLSADNEKRAQVRSSRGCRGSEQLPHSFRVQYASSTINSSSRSSRYS